MTADPNHHHTRAATRAGIYPAPKLPRDTPSLTSSPPSPTRSFAGATGSPKTRPVMPELLYSAVASAVSLSRGVSPVQGVFLSSPSVLSEPPPSLSHDVDFGRAETPSSTVVHGETMSVRSNDIDLHATPLPPPSAQSHSVSTVSKATQDMSCEELVSLARRYESMAREAMAEVNWKPSVPLDAEPDSGLEDGTHTPEFSLSSPALPAGEGSSRKGPDPRSWGAAGFSADFSEHDLEAQRKGFKNFAEINRVVKQEVPTEFTPHPHVPGVEPMIPTFFELEL
ncbi:hypothetical protein DFH08DRAFT_942061 [Mycena albidolilacea]|uniref:Uncharacterized protein n=1 Tax=Mycena albidolilacea TaxID=1033008 RepID=A0AAD6ZFH7_9AGAR|nr:hypothetical protein DFH08DRAFT_942061 [Mycena albidolilacea]